MKIKLLGKNLDDIRPLLKKYGFEEVDNETPGLIIAHGGDGTLLTAESQYPGIPKFPLRDVATAPHCSEHSYEEQLTNFINGKTRLSFLPKVAAKYKSHVVHGINDVFVHNKERVSALRYRVRIDGELYANEIVGDAVGVSTVHGSTAYYRSITHSIFRVGIGLAFSNSTEEISHLVLGNDSSVEIEIIRGPALLVADNTMEPFEINTGDTVTMYQSDLSAEVFDLETFMCPKCRALRHPKKNRYDSCF